MITLRLSHNSPMNTILLDEDETPMYTISTARRVFRRTTFIARHTFDVDGQATGIIKETARIHWHHLTASKLVYNVEIREINKVIPRTGFKRLRVLTAPDGKRYKWELTLSGLQLKLMEGPKSAQRVVVKIPHRGLRDIFAGKKPAIEIDESVLPFLDLIIATWVYIEQRRRDSRH